MRTCQSVEEIVRLSDHRGLMRIDETMPSNCHREIKLPPPSLSRWRHIPHYRNLHRLVALPAELVSVVIDFHYAARLVKNHSLHRDKPSNLVPVAIAQHCYSIRTRRVIGRTISQPAWQVRITRRCWSDRESATSIASVDARRPVRLKIVRLTDRGPSADRVKKCRAIATEIKLPPTELASVENVILHLQELHRLSLPAELVSVEKYVFHYAARLMKNHSLHRGKPGGGGRRIVIW